MRRNVPLYKIFCNYYVIFVFLFIFWIYHTTVFQVLVPQFAEYPIFTSIELFFIHAATLMLLWSMLQTMITDPGRVPLYWGFFLDDPEHKKRRYCLICHIFKPERCHHCSTCNRCVLNMDHHCPWINNCVGFSNRKFFLLLVIYVTVDLFFINAILFPKVVSIIRQLPESLTVADVNLYLAFALTAPLLIVITNFLKFHLQLVSHNVTTIENLEKQRHLQENAQGEAVAPEAYAIGGSKYDMGARENWVQVWGKAAWLYPFPIFGDSGNPAGDGVTWPQQVMPTSNLETAGVNDGECTAPGGANGSGVTPVGTSRRSNDQQRQNTEDNPTAPVSQGSQIKVSLNAALERRTAGGKERAQQ